MADNAPCTTWATQASFVNKIYYPTENSLIKCYDYGLEKHRRILIGKRPGWERQLEEKESFYWKESSFRNVSHKTAENFKSDRKGSFRKVLGPILRDYAPVMEQSDWLILIIGL